MRAIGFHQLILNSVELPNIRWCIVRAHVLLALAVFAVGIGCGADETIWSAEARSPDGRWLARAQTVQTGGFGTGITTTDVNLKWIKGSDRPETILVFVHDPRSVPDAIHLSMNWVTPSHLEVTYDGHPRMNFQVVKYGDVEISLRDLSKATTNTSQ
jgi:hypothetical protein